MVSQIFSPAAVLSGLVETFVHGNTQKKLIIKLLVDTYDDEFDMPAQVNGDAKKFFHLSWNVMETALSLAL